jgi:hypothetical protein
MNTTKLLLLSALVVGTTQAMDQVRPEEMEPGQREAFFACNDVEQLINHHKETYKDLQNIVHAYSKCFRSLRGDGGFLLEPNPVLRIIASTENGPFCEESDKKDVAKILNEMAQEAHTEGELLQSKTVVIRGYKFDPRENISALRDKNKQKRICTPTQNGQKIIVNDRTTKRTPISSLS